MMGWIDEHVVRLVLVAFADAEARTGFASVSAVERALLVEAVVECAAVAGPFRQTRLRDEHRHCS